MNNKQIAELISYSADLCKKHKTIINMQGYIPKDIYEIDVILMSNGSLSEENAECYLMKADEKISLLEISECLRKAIHDFCRKCTFWGPDSEEECITDLNKDEALGMNRFYLTKHKKDGYIACRLHDKFAGIYYLKYENMRDDTIIELRVYN